MILLALLLAADAPVTTHQTLFDQGVQASLEGRAEEAQGAWQRAVASGVHSADVEYNLGTSYAESNDLGRAVLHLKRAQLLRPSTDASGNLHIVRERVLEANPGHTRELSLLGDIADQLVRAPFLDVFGIALILLSGLVVLRWYVLRRRLLPVTLALTVVGATLAVSGLGELIETVYHDVKPPAVVVKRTAAKSGPDERFKTLVDLGAGEEIRLTGKEAALGFVAIELPNGEQAFAHEASIAKVKDW